MQRHPAQKLPGQNLLARGEERRCGGNVPLLGGGDAVIHAREEHGLVLVLRQFFDFFAFFHRIASFLPVLYYGFAKR